MLTRQTFFDGKVDSVGFERNGRRQTVGVVDVGEFYFGTESPERMTIVSGELAIKLTGSSEWKTYPAGTIFEVAGNSGFDIRATSPCAYLCEFL